MIKTITTNILPRLLGLVTAFSLVFSFSAPVFASDGDEDTTASASIAGAAQPIIAAKSGVLIEESTGKVLFEKNSHEKMPPASITKIMTMLLVMEAIEGGKINYDDMVTASAHACSMGGTQIWLKENEQFSVNDLLKACAVASANDAAMALAEHIGGSEEGFVAMMNNKASALGMKDTTFVNPTGLDADGHLSSAYDIALMSRALLSYPKIKEYTSIWMDSLRDGKTELVNTNKMVRFYKGCTGLKTGTTNGAGSCLSASAERNDMGLVSVVMGSTTSKERFDSAKALLDYGFASFTLYKAVLDESILTPIVVKGGVFKTVGVETDKTVTLVLPKELIKSVKQEINLLGEVLAPVKKGQKLGEVTLRIEGSNEVLAQFPLMAKNEVEEMTLWHSFGQTLKRLCEI